MKVHYLYKTLLVLLFAVPMQAQEVLKLEDAVKIALQNNYEIKIASNVVKINQANVAPGNAGMLPTVGATITDTNGLQNVSQTRSDGTTSSLNNAKSSSLSYGVNLGWTVFDGFKMFASLKQYKELEKLGEVQLKQTIITKVGDVTTTYFNLVQLQQQLMAMDTTLVISNQRLTLAQNRFSIGKASKLEVLNAQVDLNTDKTNQLKLKETYATTKIVLNQILARDTTLDFTVETAIPVNDQLKLTDLMETAKKQNPQLEAQLINKRVSELQLKQIKAGRYPTVTLNSGYGLTETHSMLGFTTQSQSAGINYGFNASLNIFNGFYQNRNEKIAKLQIDNAALAIEQQNKTLESQLNTAYQAYSTNLALTKLEKSNEAIAKQNMDITFEKFRIGTITTLEFRTAQLNYINARVRYTEAQYQAKLSEILLNELAGILKLE